MNLFKKKIKHERYFRRPLPYGNFDVEKWFLETFRSTHDEYTITNVNESFFQWLKDESGLEHEFISRCYSQDYERVVSAGDTIIILPSIKVALVASPNGRNHIRLRIFYIDRNKDVDLIIKEATDRDIFKPKEGNISLLIADDGDLYAKPFDLKINIDNIGLHYGEDFVPMYKAILKALLEPNGKGLVLLHGIPGSGKTTLIKHLASNLHKEVIFVSNSMAASLSDPGLVTFLMKHKNCILIIEEAEKIIKSRELSSTSPATSAILNLTDGILGDCLKIQVICSFNTAKEKIDDALLRKGRLIAEHKFDALPPTDANKLLKHLGKEFKTNVPMTLADIYGVDDTLYKESKERQRIGFQVHKDEPVSLLNM